MPNPPQNSNSNDIRENEQDIQELFSIGYDFSNKLKEILKKIKNSEDSLHKLKTYLFLLNQIPRELKINWIFLGNHVVRHIGKLNFSQQTEILDYIISNIDEFSNKQLATLYKTLTTIMRILEVKSHNEEVSTQHYEKIKKIRHQIYSEMLTKSRYSENSIEDIKAKYFDNPQEAIQQLVNKNQFIKDFKVIINNLEEFEKDQLEEYFRFIKNGILKYIMNHFSTPEINYLYSAIEELPRSIKIKNKRKLLNYIATRGDPFYEIKTESERVNELEYCLICKKNRITEKCRPLCINCFDEKISNFPSKFYQQENAFHNFSVVFDNFYKNYDKNLGYLIIQIDLPFDSPFTVMDLEATGDITKERTHFITTMGYLYSKKAFIYQLIDFSKQKEFKKRCRNVARSLKRPAVAYNFEGSERIWLRIYEGGWIDIQKNEIRFSEDIGERLHSLKLEDISFKWDDISGLECVEQCQKYKETGDITHLRLVAYHNFIDILREYLVGLIDLKVYDYLNGTIWNPLIGQLVIRHECPVCYHGFYSKVQFTNHINSHKRRGRKRRKSKNGKRNTN